MVHHMRGAVWGRSINAANPHLMLSIDTAAIFYSIEAKSYVLCNSLVNGTTTLEPKDGVSYFHSTWFFVHGVKSSLTLQRF